MLADLDTYTAAGEKVMVSEIYEMIGGSIHPKKINVDRAYWREMLLNANNVRPRYSVLQAAETLGWLEDIDEEVVNVYDF